MIYFRELAVVSLLLLSIVPGLKGTASGQVPAGSGIGKLENRLKTQFKLTSNELGRLRPLISRENENVARTFGHFADDRYRENFLSLWDGMRNDRREFEQSLPRDLNGREKSALRAARTEFESMVMDIWSEDYVDLLAAALELDRMQVSGIQMIFVNENESRLTLIIKETVNGVDGNGEWQKITDKRETALKGLLSPEQFRAYMALGVQVDRSVA